MIAIFFVLLSSLQRVSAYGPDLSRNRPSTIPVSQSQSCLCLLLFPPLYNPLDLFLPCFNSIIFPLGLLPSSSPLSALISFLPLSSSIHLSSPLFDSLYSLLNDLNSHYDLHFHLRLTISFSFY